MSYKYTLTDETLKWRGRTLHRIRALRDFGDVKAGDLGGWVESERNLSHEGACWLYGEAKAYGEAKLSENARAYNNAELSGNASAYDNARLSGHARASDYAQLYGRAHANDYAQLSCHASAFCCARLSHNMHATKSVIYISGLGRPVTISDNHIRIDRLVYTINEWATFSDEKIAEISSEVLKFWKRWKSIIMTTAMEHQKGRCA